MKSPPNTLSSDSSPADICLLLRAHGEHRWLTSQLLPVVRELETPGYVGEADMGAALAYLEVLTLDASRRASRTETALAALRSPETIHDRLFQSEVRRYHAAVRVLREDASRRIALLTAPPAPPAAPRQYAGL